MNAQAFARATVAALSKIDHRAYSLQVRGRSTTAVIGIEDEGEFVSLLKLAAPSARYNVMSLLVSHHGGWEPTFKRGTPEMIAEVLAGPLHHLWTIPLAMARAWDDPGGPTP